MIRRSVKRFHAGLYDQNAVVYLLQNPTHRAAVALEPVGGYGLHSHFVANLPLPMIGVHAAPALFVQSRVLIPLQMCGACR